ncbi:pimeloyl-ACP methyl ester carboxylesterase [Ancylobacter sp. 3268]|uniref:DUF3141 domain-containing protein n=1 Tax=Ancylobacter sp. 3268 TaxID=2817752 RepID=UPI00285EAB45|nr:DUF3141 domain-containing protein [Ancylobacter sp. 3268]MDR6955360.1 pimeloyl-ACP methyl ester carboxylesterase [Ancylobacter sp. 3268]
MSSAPNIFADAGAYLVDAAQRWTLFLDAMHRRGLQYEQHMAEPAPNVLDYQAELMCDGRSLSRPVNYLLARIVPPEGLAVDEVKRPFVIVDPRAGHGPGIGGFKADSEIGVALAAGHPCYFVGFLPSPVAGQTIEDIGRAEARFLEIVAARHPLAEGRPCVIGNCQAGWAVAMAAAVRPELFGPLILAGAPLSYWAGVKSVNPMRYSGGLLGGSWLTALTSDLGAGVFDGAWLVQNFENQNPANTLWTKQYNLYSKVDTETERYLGFEKWWGGHVTLNGEEIQFIVDQLFIGNKLACGEIRTSDGLQVDLRNIRSPIVVFCSRGDNITPPQQALDWILDLYDSVDEIRSYGQTIVYAVHDTVGHLGIFVSGSVAKKEHDEFASNIDFIDVLPPGLYEATFTPKTGADSDPELITGEWIMRCEARDLDDIRALGGNDIADERSFAAAARVSEINLSLYRALVQPAVRAMANPAAAETLRKLHPLRLSYEMFGSRNPMLAWLDAAAEKVREDRQPAAADNPFLKAQEQVSRQIVESLEGWRQAMEHQAELVFRTVYGSPVLQAAVGVDSTSGQRPRNAAKSPLHAELLARKIEELRAGFGRGGLLEAAIRGLLYVGSARGGADERSFQAIKRLRRSAERAGRLTLGEFKALVREQFFMLRIDRSAALHALPDLLRTQDSEAKAAAFAMIEQILAASGALQDEAAERLAEVRRLFSLDAVPALAAEEQPAQEAPVVDKTRGRLTIATRREG